jgi:hypothetical protein
VVCFDESPTQLIGEARQPIPAGSSASTTSIAATAPSISSSSSMPIALGAGSDRLVAEIDVWQSQRNQSGARINRCSPPTRPEPKWRVPIPIPRSKSHNLCVEELAALDRTSAEPSRSGNSRFARLILLACHRATQNKNAYIMINWGEARDPRPLESSPMVLRRPSAP